MSCAVREPPVLAQSGTPPAPNSPLDTTPNTMFFQAEDGIRDIGVTAVQTCALPISLFIHVAERQAQIIGDMDEERAADILEHMSPGEAADVLGDLPVDVAEDLLSRMEDHEQNEVDRKSVVLGKESRTRWARGDGNRK